MHVTRIALGTPLHSTVANMPCCLIILEVMRGLMEGIHYVVSRNLVSRTLVLLIGDGCDVKGVLDGLRKMHDSAGLTAIRMAAWFSRRSRNGTERGSVRRG